MNILSILVLFVLCYQEETQGKRRWRLCGGKKKQRRGPFADNNINQKSLWRYRDNNTRMVNMLVDWKFIQWERVRDIFVKVDRKDFVYDLPYQDIPKHLGYCSWASAPHMVAKIINLGFLNLHRGAKVLEIGSGSGYMAAIMAYMVGPTGHVTGLEHMVDICALSIANISRNHIGLIWNQTIDIIHKDGRNGHEEGGPYDLIVASCAYPEWPKHIEKQLSVQGRMIVPLGREGEYQRLYVYNKLGRGSRHMFYAGPCSFEPCVDQEVQQEKWREAEMFPDLGFVTPAMY